MADVTNMTNEGLAIEIKNLSVQIADLKAVIASNAADYIRKEVFELRMREYDSKIVGIELQIAEVKKETKRVSWKSHTLTAIFTAALVMLVSYVFNDLIAR